jgi:hypothetical protein
MGNPRPFRDFLDTSSGSTGDSSIVSSSVSAASVTAVKGVSACAGADPKEPSDTIVSLSVLAEIALFGFSFLEKQLAEELADLLAEQHEALLPDAEQLVLCETTALFSTPTTGEALIAGSPSITT